MNQVQLYELPDTSCGLNAFCYNNCILYDYQRDDGKMIRTGIGFYLITDHRERNTEVCDGWHRENWDILVEIQDSPWVEEFRSKLTGRRSHWVIRHFKLYTHDVCFEFLASEWYLLPALDGRWENVFPDYKLFGPPEEMFLAYLKRRSEST